MFLARCVRQARLSTLLFGCKLVPCCCPCLLQQADSELACIVAGCLIVCLPAGRPSPSPSPSPPPPLPLRIRTISARPANTSHPLALATQLQLTGSQFHLKLGKRGDSDRQGLGHPRHRRPRRHPGQERRGGSIAALAPGSIGLAGAGFSDAMAFVVHLSQPLTIPNKPSAAGPGRRWPSRGEGLCAGRAGGPAGSSLC